SIVEGFRYLIVQAKAGLDGANVGESLPVLGKAYAAGSAVLADLDAFTARLQLIVSTIEAATNAGTLQSNIKNWLFNNLGTTGLNVLLDSNGNGTVTIDDVTVTVMCGAAACTGAQTLLEVTDVQLGLAIGKNGLATTPKID